MFSDYLIPYTAREAAACGLSPIEWKYRISRFKPTPTRDLSVPMPLSRVINISLSLQTIHERVRAQESWEALQTSGVSMSMISPAAAHIRWLLDMIPDARDR